MIERDILTISLFNINVFLILESWITDVCKHYCMIDWYILNLARIWFSNKFFDWIKSIYCNLQIQIIIKVKFNIKVWNVFFNFKNIDFEN